MENGPALRVEGTFPYAWVPIGHSEGQFSLNVKKFKKNLETGSRGLPGFGGQKNQKRVNNELKSLFRVSFKLFFNFFPPKARDSPGTHFETFLELFHIQAELPL